MYSTARAEWRHRRVMRCVSERPSGSPGSARAAGSGEDLRRPRRGGLLLRLYAAPLAVQVAAPTGEQQRAVAAEPLRLVERVVGELQQLLGAPAGDLRVDGDARRDR